MTVISVIARAKYFTPMTVHWKQRWCKGPTGPLADSCMRVASLGGVLRPKTYYMARKRAMDTKGEIQMAARKKSQEIESIGVHAAAAAELAGANIRKYLELHRETANNIQLVMKIADDVRDKMERLVEGSANLAAKALAEFSKKRTRK